MAQFPGSCSHDRRAGSLKPRPGSSFAYSPLRTIWDPCDNLPLKREGVEVSILKTKRRKPHERSRKHYLPARKVGNYEPESAVRACSRIHHGGLHF